MLFITGTDTGVGKTFFSTSLIKALRSLGVNAVGFKPVETGCSPRCLDAELLGEASGLYIEPVYSFKSPVAPSVASDIEGVKVEVERIKKKIAELSSLYPLVVEGAGGIMVPINWSSTFLELVKELKIPVLIVALNKLGVINHTLLTYKVCSFSGVNVVGVVLNSFRREDESFDTNLLSLRRLLPAPVFSFSSPEDALPVARHLLPLFS